MDIIEQPQELAAPAKESLYKFVDKIRIIRLVSAVGID